MTDTSDQPTHCSVSGKCELTAITASQLSTLLILLGYLVYRVWKITSDIPDAVPVEMTAVVALIVVYVFLCLWVIEERYIRYLRSLTLPASWLEFYLRVGAIIVLFLMPNIVAQQGPIPHGLSPLNPYLKQANISLDSVDYLFVFLALLYMAILLWWLIVRLSPISPKLRNDITRPEKIGAPWLDFIGLVIIIAIECLRFVNTNLTALVLISFVPYAIWRIGDVYLNALGDPIPVHRRLKNRDLLR